MLTRLKVGTVFARNYRVLALLAEGGFGTVYRVEQTDNGKLRALKILQGGLVADPRMRERFTQEARIGAMIESDHVVEVSAAGIDEATGTPWLAMELLDGSDLAQVMERERRLSPARVLSVLEDVCDALAAAHAKGILHLDLKPENLFLARKRLRGVSEVVKVLDFGIARIAAEGRRSATVTTTLGTCLWASPEQAQKAAKVSPASDVWALGVIAFYLLTGKHYWDAANVEPGEKINNVAVVVEVQTSTLPPASVRARKLGVADALPAGFDRWFGRCVARQAGKRYRDAGQLIAGLRETLDGRSATQVSSPPSQVSPPVAVPTVALDGETKKRTKKPPRSAKERGLAEAQDKSASSSAASATQLLSEAPQAPLLPPIAVLTEVMGGGRKKRAKNPPAKPATRKSAAEARNKPTPPSAAPSSPAVLATQVLGEVPQAPVLPPIAVPTEVMGGDGAGRAKRTPPKSAKRDVAGSPEKPVTPGPTPSWPAMMKEGFKVEPPGWSFAATARTPPLRFNAPGLVVTLPGGETSVAAYWHELMRFADVSISVTISPLFAQEPAQSYAGVSFRAKSDKDNYRVFIDGEGYYRLTRRVANTSTALVDWTRHEALKAGVGEENRLRVVAIGSEISVYANDVRLTTIKDDTFGIGHVALHAQGGSTESKDATVFVFRNLEIAAPLVPNRGVFY